MAGINDALGAFALGTLGKAAGQDFLGPMLQDVRQRDFFTFQKKQIDDAQEKERRRRRDESAASKRGLLDAFRQAGALTEEDIALGGGPDALAALEDGDFQLALAQFSDRRTRSMEDADLFAAVRGMAAASGIAIPEGGLSTRAQAIELKSKMDYDRLLAEDRKRQRSESTGAFADYVQALNSQVGQMLSDDLGQVDNRTLAAARANVALGMQKLANEDMDELTRNTFTTLLNGMLTGIEQRAPLANVNEYARNRRGGALLSDLSQLPDDASRRAALRHPDITPALAQLTGNFSALKQIGSEADAATAGLSGPWAAVKDVATWQEIMDNPAAVQAVHDAPVAKAASIAEARVARENALQQGAEAQAAASQYYGLLGFDLTVPADAGMETVDTVNGPRQSFNQEKYARAVMGEIAGREIPADQALTILRAKGTPPELQTKAQEAVLNALDTDDVLVAYEAAKSQSDAAFQEAAAGLTTEFERENLVSPSLSADKPFDPRYFNYTFAQATTAPDSMPARIFQAGVGLWSARDFSTLAAAALDRATAEQGDFSGVDDKGVSDALDANLAAADAANAREVAKAELRQVVINGALASVRGQAASAIEGEGKDDFAATLGLTKLPETAHDLAVMLSEAARPDALVSSGLSAAAPGGLASGSAELFRLIEDERAHWLEIAENIDLAFSADDKKRAALFAATRKRLPRDVNEKQMAAYFFLRTAEAAMAP